MVRVTVMVVAAMVVVVVMAMALATASAMAMAIAMATDMAIAMAVAMAMTMTMAAVVMVMVMQPLKQQCLKSRGQQRSTASTETPVSRSRRYALLPSCLVRGDIPQRSSTSWLLLALCSSSSSSLTYALAP